MVEAHRWYEKALSLYRQLNDPFNIGNVLAELARISALEGDIGAAQALAAYIPSPPNRVAIESTRAPWRCPGQSWRFLVSVFADADFGSATFVGIAAS